MDTKTPAIETFQFASSQDLDFPVSVRIVTLQGKLKPLPYSTLLSRPDLRHIGSNLSQNSDLYVTVQVWADSKPLTTPVQTPYKAFKDSRTWNEWLILPITYKSLPLNAQLAITAWDLNPDDEKTGATHSFPFGGTTFPIFDQESTLHKGRQKCKFWRNKVADGYSSTTTPALPQVKRTAKGIKAKDVEGAGSGEDDEDEMIRIETLLKKQELGEIPKIEWLDQMVFRALEKRGHFTKKKVQRRNNRPDRAQYFAAADGSEDLSPASSGDERETDEKFFLHIDLPRFDHPIVYSDFEYPAPPISSLMKQSTGSINLRPPPEVQFGPGIDGHGGYSQEAGHRLISIYDPEVGAKDNPAETKHRRLVRNPRSNALDKDLKPNAKIRDELNMIMQHSPTHRLTQYEKDSIWKFRHHLTSDKRALTKLVKSISWNDPGEVKHAVSLLPKWTEIDIDDALELLGPSFDNVDIRAFAVDRLRKADNDELLLYLLQLVQALKFEKTSTEATDDTTDSSLARFLIDRAVANMKLGNYFHWYLMVECDDQHAPRAKQNQQLFGRVAFDFQVALTKSLGGTERRDVLRRQGELIAILSKISKEIRFSREDRNRKIEHLKKFVADPSNGLAKFNPPLPLPLDPTISVVSCQANESNVFKSSLFPLYINFKAEDGRNYPIIFKTGDDLRQDQLVIQIISLMDRLLLKENLDLKLTPYRIVATAAHAGAVQFVHSQSLSAIQTKYKSTLAYLQSNNPDAKADYGVRKDAMETYIRSCAGYCVITYILGVGDRHLDNLLITPDGHFFHADFGYILGRDPKPFAPAMKLCKEMVDGMGGNNSLYWYSFKQFCFTAYTTLRKSSNLILNLFSLMVDANIPDIMMDPEKAVLKVMERFHLDRTEEEAIAYFETLINDNLNAVFPVVIDRLHGFVQAFRP
ncbi:MAG: Phosphatidylinositol (PI) 3-kinase [Vezdaea aestivalis]|nr:MAG: Phosphatidylinositol (PI) 3-kinase [Vezdaea aestivalis]